MPPLPTPTTERPSADFIASRRKAERVHRRPDIPLEQWPSQMMQVQRVANDRVIESLAFARPGDVPGLPASLEGIFWIDQFLQSSVGQQPQFHGADNRWPFMWVTPSTETLAAFGDWPIEWVSHEQEPVLSHDRVNPMGTARYIPNGGGYNGHWTFGTYPNSAFCYLFGCVNTLMRCCCLPDTMVPYISTTVTWDIRLAADMRFNRREEIEDPELNPEGIEIILDFFSGDEYINTAPLFELRMQKRPWGWARTTHVIEGAWAKMSPNQQAGLKKILPPPLYYGLKKGGIWGASQYPVVQIVDGQGKKTKYYDEYLEWANRQNPSGQYMGTFRSDSQSGNCLERCLASFLAPFLECGYAFCNDEPPCVCSPCCTCGTCCPCCAKYADKYRSPLPFTTPRAPSLPSMDRH